MVNYQSTVPGRGLTHDVSAWVNSFTPVVSPQDDIGLPIFLAVVGDVFEVEKKISTSL